MVIGDLTKECDVERVVKETINHFQRLDVLVNIVAVIFVGFL